MDMNYVHITGRVGNEPEVKFLSNGSPKCTLRVASSRVYTVADERREDTTWVDVDVWGKDAENAAKYLGKGSKVLVTGALRYDEWEKDGQKRSKLYINAVPMGVIFLDTKKPTGEARDEGHGGSRRDERPNRPAPAKQPQSATPATDAIADEDIPF